MSRQYSRVFISLKQDRAGYGYRGKEPSGRCVIEARDGLSKITVYIQDIKPEVIYKAYIISSDHVKTEALPIGTLAIDAKGKAELKYEFDADNICGTGKAIEDFNVIAIIIPAKNELITPLAGYRDQAVTWKNNWSGNYDNKPPVQRATVERLSGEEKPRDMHSKQIVNEAEKAEALLAEKIPSALKAYDEASVHFEEIEEVTDVPVNESETASIKSEDSKAVEAEVKEAREVSTEAEEAGEIDTGAEEVREVSTEAEEALEVSTKAEEALEVSTEAGEALEVSTKVEEVLEVSTKAEEALEVSTKAEEALEVSTEAGGVLEVSTKAEEAREVSTEAEEALEVSTKAEEALEVSTEAGGVLEVSTKAEEAREVSTEAEEALGIDTKVEVEREVNTKAEERGEIDTETEEAGEVSTEAVDEKISENAVEDKAEIVEQNHTDDVYLASDEIHETKHDLGAGNREESDNQPISIGDDAQNAIEIGSTTVDKEQEMAEEEAVEMVETVEIDAVELNIADMQKENDTTRDNAYEIESKEDKSMDEMVETESQEHQKLQDQSESQDQPDALKYIDISSDENPDQEKIFTRDEKKNAQEASTGTMPDIAAAFMEMAAKINKELKELEQIAFVPPDGVKDEAVYAESENVAVQDGVNEIFFSNVPMRPFQKQNINVTWVRITMRELIFLQIDHWKYMNHPFIVSAYNTFKHMILGKYDDNGETRYFLGVPEIYDSGFKRRAMSLGFTQFKCCEDVRLQNGEFGYWILPVTSAHEHR